MTPQNYTEEWLFISAQIRHFNQKPTGEPFALFFERAAELKERLYREFMSCPNNREPPKLNKSFRNEKTDC